VNPITLFNANLDSAISAKRGYNPRANASKFEQ
jgi:hypothetical protein